ncbi:F-box associated ubiquitination effector family protein, partial [Striga hermonthica]
FLPFNYRRMIYQKFQTLRQGSRSVDDYTEEFYRLLKRIDVRETDDQLVLCYIGGLRVSIEDTFNLFIPDSVSDGHQCAVMVEQQQARWVSSKIFPAPWRGDGMASTNVGLSVYRSEGAGTSAGLSSGVLGATRTRSCGLESAKIVAGVQAGPRASSGL